MKHAKTATRKHNDNQNKSNYSRMQPAEEKPNWFEFFKTFLNNF